MTASTTSAFEATATDWANGKISIIPAPDAAWGFVLAIDGIAQHLQIEAAEAFIAARLPTLMPDDLCRLAAELEAAARVLPQPANLDDEKWRDVVIRSIDTIRHDNQRH